MKKIIIHLKKNLLGYAFETFVIIIGILGAFSLNNWNESRKTHHEDIEFLFNLKSELSLDTASLANRKSYYVQINNDLKKSLKLFDQNPSLSEKDIQTISNSLLRMEVLTPVHKNIARNDAMIAQGKLERINKELNFKFLTYLKRNQSENSIHSKLGESLQMISINNVFPIVDYNFLDYANKKVDFQFEKIRNDRGVRNGFHKSIFFRQSYITAIETQIADAEEMLLMVDKLLEKY